jgi:hypothetical protein
MGKHDDVISWLDIRWWSIVPHSHEGTISHSPHNSSSGLKLFSIPTKLLNLCHVFPWPFKNETDCEADTDLNATRVEFFPQKQ